MPRSEHNSSKTHCPAGHSYSGENLYIDPKTGSRQCRECRRTNNRNWFRNNSSKRRAHQRKHYRKVKSSSTDYSHWRDRQRSVASRIRADKQEFLREVLGVACVDCGDDRLGAIQHHHVYGRDRDVPATLTNLSWDALKDEAMKLIALCGACHGVRHHQERQAS